MVHEDPQVKERLGGLPNRGVDFTDSITLQEYDITTPGQVSSKYVKYGSKTIIIDTSGDKPIMPEGQAVPPDVAPEMSPAPDLVSSPPLTTEEPELIPGELFEIP